MFQILQGLADCRAVKELAIVRYDGAPNEDPDESELLLPKGTVVNPYNEEASSTAIPIVKLNSSGKFSGSICLATSYQSDHTVDRMLKYYVGQCSWTRVGQGRLLPV